MAEESDSIVRRSRKRLITAGHDSTEMSWEVWELHDQGACFRNHGGNRIGASSRKEEMAVKQGKSMG